MRIGIVNWSRRQVGGAERYLAQVVPALADAGHTVSLWTETDVPSDRERILPEGRFPAFTASEMGTGPAVAALKAWAPDLLYCHGLGSPSLEERILDLAPAVFFAHNYYGTCISGAKSFQLPAPRPCHRRFGLACFAHFYPRRCGGLNPGTMVRQYRVQAERLRVLTRYAIIVTSSEHMRAEYVKHGFSGQRVRRVTFMVGTGSPSLARTRSRDAPWHLAFVGRMERTKGGATLFDAIAAVRSRLTRPVRLTLAGDGPDRRRWERQAARLAATDRAVTATFTGWLDEPRLGAVLDDADLLVVPSTWPEPFGLVGPEAGLRGVPAAAFAVGGIPEWLEEGVNGCLAPGDPPRVAGLADAIARCLATPDGHRRLRDGAVRAAQRFSLSRHMAELEGVLAAARAPRAHES